MSFGYFRLDVWFEEFEPVFFDPGARPGQSLPGAPPDVSLRVVDKSVEDLGKLGEEPPSLFFPWAEVQNQHHCDAFDGVTVVFCLGPYEESLSGPGELKL